MIKAKLGLKKKLKSSQLYILDRAGESVSNQDWGPLSSDIPSPFPRRRLGCESLSPVLFLDQKVWMKTKSNAKGLKVDSSQLNQKLRHSKSFVIQNREYKVWCSAKAMCKENTQFMPKIDDVMLD